MIDNNWEDERAGCMDAWACVGDCSQCSKRYIRVDNGPEEDDRDDIW